MAILDHIYEAATDEEAFAALPMALAQHLGARSSSMLGYDHTRQIRSFAANHFTPPMYAFQQDPEVAALDVWTGLGARPDLIGQIVNCADYWDTPAFRHTPYFNECIRGFGDDSVHCMGTVIRSGADYLAVAIHNGDPRHPFDMSTAARLGKLTPHVFRMMELRARFNALRGRADLLQVLLDEGDEGILALDANARVTAANQRGLALLEARDGVALVGGRVTPALGALADRFANSVRDAATWSGRHADAMRLPRQDPLGPIQAIVSPLSGYPGLALVILEDPNERDPGAADILRRLYDLTAAEAALASLLVVGLTPDEAAEARQVRLNTVRTQIKSLLQKTDAPRLTDLIRILARTPRRPGSAPTARPSGLARPPGSSRRA